jgi:hypothetical protein
MQRQSSVAQMAPQMTGICIVALPREYRTCAEVKDLIENILQVGQVSSVHLAETMAKTGIAYSTANIVLTSFTSSALQSELDRGDGRATIEVPHGLSMKWDNGKPMGHLSIRQLDISRFEFCSPLEKMSFPDGACPSLHIPIIPRNMMRFSALTSTAYNKPKEGFYDSESGMTDLIQNKLGLGQVKRIDFVVRDDKDGNPKAAFIHFDHWYDNKNSRFLMDKLEESGSFRQKGYYDGFNMQRFQVQQGAELQDAYIVFKINHKPIPDVDESTCELNIHQLVASNKRLMESETTLMVQVAALTARIAELESQQTSISASDSEMSAEKEELGMRLFRIIEVNHPKLAGKITGMILELDVPDILELLEGETSAPLDARIAEALRVLGYSE